MTLAADATEIGRAVSKPGDVCRAPEAGRKRCRPHGPNLTRCCKAVLQLSVCVEVAQKRAEQAERADPKPAPKPALRPAPKPAPKPALKSAAKPKQRASSIGRAQAVRP